MEIRSKLLSQRYTEQPLNQMRMHEMTQVGLGCAELSSKKVIVMVSMEVGSIMGRHSQGSADACQPLIPLP